MVLARINLKFKKEYDIGKLIQVDSFLSYVRGINVDSSQDILIVNRYNRPSSIIEFVTQAAINDQTSIKTSGFDLHSSGFTPGFFLHCGWECASRHWVS